MSGSMKRPAAASKAGRESKAKRQQQDPLTVKCNAIADVVSTAEGYPSATLNMLAASVKGCLGVSKENRHDVQKDVIKMISEVLSSMEAGHAAKLASLREKIAEADLHKARRGADVEAAVQAKVEKTDAVQAAEKAVLESTAGTKIAQEELVAATSEQTACDLDLLQAAKKKDSAEKVQSSDLAALKDGTVADVAKAVKAVTDVGEELGLEAQLISSATIALKKMPDQRGGFDGIVVSQVDEQLGKAIETLAEQLDNGEAAKAERAAKVEACKQRVDAATAHGEECQEQLKAAKAALKEAEAARRAAEKAVKDFGPEMQEATAKADAAEAVLTAFQVNVAMFRELVEGPAAEPAEPPCMEQAPCVEQPPASETA